MLSQYLTMPMTGSNEIRRSTSSFEYPPLPTMDTTPPMEEEEARQWIHRQRFYSAMITAKLTHGAAQRINAFEISQVQLLLRAVKDSFKPEGSGTYVNLQRRYMSLTREKCGALKLSELRLGDPR